MPLFGPGAAASTLIPIAASIGKEIHAGIQRRKERLYNSPTQQVKRLREAGLPTAAGSNITGGITQPAIVGGDNYGTTALNDNLGKSITRQIDRKKVDIAEQELRAAKAAADIATGNAKNILNPSGVFEPTNQGITAMQGIQQQAAAIKTAETINKWMPLEKAQAILKNTKEMAKISADTANSLTQNGILVSEGKIKGILSKYQERMSSGELTNLIRRNTGLKNANDISSIQGEILRNTKISQMKKIIEEATMAGQMREAKQLSLLVQNLETDSAIAYYKIRARVDKSYDKGVINGGIINPRDIIYLQMFNATTSGNMNLGNFMGGIK